MSGATSSARWVFSRIALIVTGEGEREFLPDLFRSLSAEGHCMFQVTHTIGQLSPIRSEPRRERMVGTGSPLATRDQEIGLYARSCLLARGFDYVILIDDLEHARRDISRQVYDRYRQAIDVMLRPLELEAYASVHFLVNMLEAYYFADAVAINAVLGTELADHPDDVETIRHPKGDLKVLFRGYREVDHGRLIVRNLDLRHVLARSDTCASLRALIGWCAKAIWRPFDADYQLETGVYSPLTGPQIGRLP
jgi:hypothetical protein